MAAKQGNLLPVLALGGLAIVLLMWRQRQARAGVTGTPAPAGTAATGDAAARASAISQIVTGVLGYLGGVTGNTPSAGTGTTSRASEAALDQIIADAQAWAASNSGYAGVSGDPYNPDY